MFSAVLNLLLLSSSEEYFADDENCSYESQLKAIVSLAAYAKQFCYRLVVRIHPNSIAGIQHPIPASSFLKSLYKLSLDYDIVLIFPNEKVSAYGLISYSKAVFVDTSHVFLESLMAGHPAFITSNSATYKDLFSHRYFGFTESLENLNFNSEDILKAAMLFKHIRIDSSYKNSAPISSQEKLFHKQPSLTSMINRINANPSRLDNINEGLINAFFQMLSWMIAAVRIS